MSSPVVGMQETSTITPSQKFEGHAHWITGAIHLPDGQRMMTCSFDGSLRVWNLTSGKQIGDDWRNGDSGVWTSTALSLGGKKMVSGSQDGGVRLWDIGTGKVIAKWTGDTETVGSVCWSRDGWRVIDGAVREWDVEKGETVLGSIETGHQHMFTVVYSPDMTMFATGGGNWQSIMIRYLEIPVKIWDANTGELVATLKGHKFGVVPRLDPRWNAYLRVKRFLD